MLKSYRVTKYNPNKRNIKWLYINNNEWTSIYDFKNWNLDEYFEIENKYINIVQKFMKINNINFLKIKKYEKNNKYDDIKFKNWLDKKVYDKIGDNVNIFFDEIPTIIRLLLRENIWCKLYWKRWFFLHFWYDLYMYIWFNPSKRIERLVSNIFISDIYIEEFRSPYLKN